MDIGPNHAKSRSITVVTFMFTLKRLAFFRALGAIVLVALDVTLEDPASGLRLHVSQMRTNTTVQTWNLQPN